jgi:hypothetical protein
MPVRTVWIVLDVRVDGEEISGYAHDSVAQRKPFVGWLGMIAALDGLVAVPRPSDTEWGRGAGPAISLTGSPTDRGER